MNIMIADPWTTIPAAVVFCGLGAGTSAAIFNKLSHLVEYTLNKRFGDYKNAKKTLDNRIIVSRPTYEDYFCTPKDYYYAQNIALTILISVISSKAIQVLVVPSAIAIPFKVGSVVASIFFCLRNMILRFTGDHHGRWVEVSEATIKNRYGYVEVIRWSHHVYCGFGSAPKCFLGEIDMRLLTESKSY